MSRNTHDMPRDWVAEPLGSVMTNIIDFRGKTPLKIGMNWDGGNIPALSANNVEMGKINFAKECYFGSDALYSKWMNNGDCAKNDVVMTMEAPLGNVALIPDDKKYILSQRVILMKPDSKKLSGEYLFHFLQSDSFQRMMDEESTGTTAKGIQRRKLEKLLISRPRSIDEQKKIVQILNTINEEIELTEKLIGKKRAIKKGLVQDLIYAKKHDKPIGDVIDILDNLRIPINDEERQKRGGYVPYYGANGLQGFIDKPLFNEPLILMAEDGGNFEQFAERPIAYRISGPSWVNNHAHILRARSYNQDYLFYVLEHMNILSLISGGTRAKLNQGELKKIKVPSTDIDEQKYIAELLNLIVDEINELSILKTKLITRKQGLMQDLLTGRVRVENVRIH